jgi:hypothetical protein
MPAMFTEFHKFAGLDDRELKRNTPMKKQFILFGSLACVFAVATSCGQQDNTAQDMEMAAMRAVMAQGGPGSGGGSTTTVTQTNTITKTATSTVTNTNSSSSTSTSSSTN